MDSESEFLDYYLGKKSAKTLLSAADSSWLRGGGEEVSFSLRAYPAPVDDPHHEYTGNTIWGVCLKDLILGRSEKN